MKALLTVLILAGGIGATLYAFRASIFGVEPGPTNVEPRVDQPHPRKSEPGELLGGALPPTKVAAKPRATQPQSGATKSTPVEPPQGPSIQHPADRAAEQAELEAEWDDTIDRSLPLEMVEEMLNSGAVEVEDLPPDRELATKVRSTLVGAFAGVVGPKAKGDAKRAFTDAGGPFAMFLEQLSPNVAQGSIALRVRRNDAEPRRRAGSRVLSSGVDRDTGKFHVVLGSGRIKLRVSLAKDSTDPRVYALFQKLKPGK